MRRDIQEEVEAIGKASIYHNVEERQVVEIWWCEHLHVGYVKGDTTPGARKGLADWCREVHHESCGWRLLIDPPEDTE